MGPRGQGESQKMKKRKFIDNKFHQYEFCTFQRSLCAAVNPLRPRPVPLLKTIQTC